MATQMIALAATAGHGVGPGGIARGLVLDHDDVHLLEGEEKVRPTTGTRA
jgi:hypothetical protein